MWHKPRMSLELPVSEITGTFPKMGQLINIKDERGTPALTGSFFIRGISYDFLGRKMILTGEGGTGGEEGIAAGTEMETGADNILLEDGNILTAESGNRIQVDT